MFDGLSVLSIAIAYLIGAMPFGLFVVKKLTGNIDLGAWPRDFDPMQINCIF